MKQILLILLLLVFQAGRSQTTCTAPGQNPTTAFPVCGTATFTQNSVPICGGRTLPNPSCNSYPLADINPYWYKFTCFQTGTLAFRIRPLINAEDYDWQLFDITNRNPMDVYTDASMVVSCNWSGEFGETGANASGTNLFVCEGGGRPLWSKMPVLQQGHEYLLLVSHFTQTQSGYDLSFGGGTAVITDSTPPRLRTADAACGGNMLRLKLNKKMKCSSLAGNGSDFYITPGNYPVSSASGFGCATGFDMDSIQLTLGAFLAPGSYTLNVKRGTDGNTLLDYCNKELDTTDKINFTVYPLVPTPMDSIVALTCKPSYVKLVFRKPMLCSSIAGNGTDFLLNGPNGPVPVVREVSECGPNTLQYPEIFVHFASPLTVGGTYTLTLVTGSDGNTLLDECGKETPAGSTISFTVGDSVSAAFSFTKAYGCQFDTVRFIHPGGNGINRWNWSLDEGRTSTQQNPVVLYQQFTNKNVQLIVGNGFCTDTARATVVLDNFIKADFTAWDDLCPNEPTQFTGNPQGRVVSHLWNFGDGAVAIVPAPQHTYSMPNTNTNYLVRYTVTDSLGCSSTAQKDVRVYSSCYLDLPSAFTPNRDGLNDFFGPLNAVKAEDVEFRVFNRWGQLIYQTRNWKAGWDGKLKGLEQASGVYVWFLTWTDRDSRERRQRKGTVALIR